MAHRLSQTPGKCEAIHGHSWWITLHIRGPVQENGMVIEYGELKRQFRHYLDSTFDHHLLLWDEDPWLQGTVHPVPGLRGFETDPTTENLAQHLYNWACKQFGEAFSYAVEVWETSVNMARVGDF